MESVSMENEINKYLAIYQRTVDEMNSQIGIAEAMLGKPVRGSIFVTSNPTAEEMPVDCVIGFDMSKREYFTSALVVTKDGYGTVVSVHPLPKRKQEPVYLNGIDDVGIDTHYYCKTNTMVSRLLSYPSRKRKRPEESGRHYQN